MIQEMSRKLLDGPAACARSPKQKLGWQERVVIRRPSEVLKDDQLLNKHLPKIFNDSCAISFFLILARFLNKVRFLTTTASSSLLDILL